MLRADDRSSGRSGIKKFTAIHDENASFMALNAGAITSRPPCEWSARSSSFSTHPFQPISRIVAATFRQRKSAGAQLDILRRS